MIMVTLNPWHRSLNRASCIEHSLDLTYSGWEADSSQGDYRLRDLQFCKIRNMKNWMGRNPILKFWEGNFKRMDLFLKTLNPLKLLINLLKKMFIKDVTKPKSLLQYRTHSGWKAQGFALPAQREHFSYYPSRRLSLPSQQEQHDFWPNF